MRALKTGVIAVMALLGASGARADEPPIAFRRAGPFGWPIRIDRHTLESAYPLLHVAAVAASLGVLAVVDDVDAVLDLPIDDFDDSKVFSSPWKI